MPTNTTKMSSRPRKVRKYAKIVAISGAGISVASLLLSLIPILLMGIVITVVSAIVLIVTKPKSEKVTELPPEIRKVRKYAKMTALSGGLIAIVSLFLAFLENQSNLLVGVVAGTLIIIASATVGLMKPAKADLYIRKILGILILATALPFVILNPLVLITAFGFFVPSITFGMYLLFSRRYHLKLDVFWVSLGFLLYYGCPINYPVVPLFWLKGFVLTADWACEGVGFQTFYLFFFLGFILIFGSALFLLVTDFLSRRWDIAQPAKRGLTTTVILLVILGTVFVLPWLYPTGVRLGNGLIVESLHPVGAFRSYGIVPSVSFISENSTWIYQIVLINKGFEDGEIIGIMGKVVSQTVKIGTPFGNDVEVVGGNRTAEKIVVKPETTVMLKISSKDPLWFITLIEKGDKRWQIMFWS